MPNPYATQDNANEDAAELFEAANLKWESSFELLRDQLNLAVMKCGFDTLESRKLIEKVAGDIIDAYNGENK